MDLMSNMSSEECEKITPKEECTEIEISLNLFQYLSSDDFNVQNLCRICLSVNNMEMYSVTRSKENNDTLPELFSSFTTIHVHPNDGLPANICNICKTQLVNSHEFKTKCVKANCMLKSLLKGEYVAKEENCDEVVRTNVNKESTIDASNLKDIKEENEDMTEDVQYLEDLSDNEALCILQNAGRSKEKRLTKFSTTDSQKLFKEIKKKKKSSVCTLCSKRFPNIKALSNHLRRNHSNAELPNACIHCKETFSSDHDLNLHLPLHSKGPVWTCVECRKEFKARAILRRHVARHMSVKRWACEACGKSFTELYALRRHTRTHTGQRVEKRHACHLCEKRYSEASLLAAHISRHSGVRSCVCDVCGKAFPTARLLASHRLVHIDSKPYACQYCEKRFRHESTRSTHHRTHTGEKPYVCTVCGKTFIQNSNLTLHMRTHTGERPYRCETCGRKFSSGSTLKNHVRTHTGEKPYSCNECGKKFARMDLSAHMRQHTGERPFECSVCYRKFITAARLRDHCRIHTGEKPFECAMCSQKFATKSHMVKHLKSHDSKKQQDREAVIIRHATDRTSDGRFDFEKDIKIQSIISNTVDSEDQSLKKIDVGIEVDEEPIEVTQEYILPDEDAQSELLVVDDTQNSFQNAALCLTTGGGNYSNDVNLVAVNEGEVRMLEGTTVKLYQLDQSLVQIHSSAGQVTISKITSKMTANF